MKQIKKKKIFINIMPIMVDLLLVEKINFFDKNLKFALFNI